MRNNSPCIGQNQGKSCFKWEPLQLNCEERSQQPFSSAWAGPKENGSLSVMAWSVEAAWNTFANLHETDGRRSLQPVTSLTWGFIWRSAAVCFWQWNIAAGHFFLQFLGGWFFRVTCQYGYFMNTTLFLSAVCEKHHLPDSHSWNIRIVYKSGCIFYSKAKNNFCR